MMFSYKRGNFEIRRSKLHDICELAPIMRDLDREEIKASHGNTAEQALITGYITSQECYTIELSGEVIAMFGANPSNLGQNIGCAWLLGSDKIDQAKAAFARASAPAINHLLTKYDTLYNFIDQRHERSIEWIKWLGANVYESQPYGVEGKPFRMFVFDKEESPCVDRQQSQ